MKVVKVTTHAVERYRERVKPAFDYDQAFDDLVRCLRAHADVVEELPGWVWQLPEGYELDDDLLPDYDAVAMVGGDIALPLFDKGDCLLAVTCITRAGMPEGARRYVNRAKQRRRAGRRTARKRASERAIARQAKHSGAPRRDAA